MIKKNRFVMTVTHAQARRLICDHCKKPYSYVQGGTVTKDVLGTGILESPEKMQKILDKRFKDHLGGLAKRKGRGTALCPHCHYYPKFVVKRSVSNRAGIGALIGGGIGFIGALTAISMTHDPNASGSPGCALPCWIWMIAIGLGVLAGKLLALKAGPHPDRKDLMVMTDEQLTSLLSRGSYKYGDPVMDWYTVAAGVVEITGQPINLGMKDTTGEPITPPELDTDKILPNLVIRPLYAEQSWR